MNKLYNRTGAFSRAGKLQVNISQQSQKNTTPIKAQQFCIGFNCTIGSGLWFFCNLQSNILLSILGILDIIDSVIRAFQGVQKHFQDKMSSSASQAIKDKNTKHQISLIYFLLLIFGRVMAFYSINNSVFTRSPYGRPIWDFYMQTRLVWLDTLIKEVKQTGIYTGLHRLYDHNSVMYLYLSRLGVFLGADSAYTIYFAQLAITAAWMAVLPALWYRATSSIPRAVASSLFLQCSALTAYISEMTVTLHPA